MKQLERDLDLISVILADAEVMEKRMKRFSMTEDKFINDRTEDGELAYDAIMSPIYRISEDACHLSESVVERFPDYPWRQIKGFRNFVAHGYREVDRRIAWEVADKDIPELVKVLKKYWKESAPATLSSNIESEGA